MKKVDICGIVTSQLETLNSEESEKMLRAIKESNDQILKDQFIRCNLKLVLSVVQRFINRKENLDDIFQIGTIGLIKAIENFDFKFNVKFSTYAVPMIIGEIKRYLRDYSSIRVSRSLKDIAYRALKLKEEENKPNMTSAQIAEKLGVSEEEVILALESLLEPFSLYASAFNDDSDGVYLLDQIKDNADNEEKWVEVISIRQAIAKLADKEKDIIYMRYYQGKTQNEIAADIGISQAQVSRLEKIALKKMKETIGLPI